MYTEIQVKNSYIVPLCIDSIRFIPEKQFTVFDINQGVYEGQKRDETASLFESIIWLKPSQSRQYLYKVQETEAKNVSNNNVIIKTLTFFFFSLKLLLDI